MRLIIILLLLSTSNLICQEIIRINSEKSSVSYTGNHFLHKWSAENKNINGIVQVNDQSILNIGAVAKVSDFKSGNSSLDSNSFRVLEALKFPNIIFKSTSINEIDDKITINGLIEFHGIEKSISLLANIDEVEGFTQLTGNFVLKLSEFLIERPSLLLRKIDDEISISFNVTY